METPWIHPYLVVKKSGIHGLGIFSSEPIPGGTVIEKSGILPIGPPGEGILPDYRFGWPIGEKWTEYVVCLGFGSYYNHSKEPNAYWTGNKKNRLLVFITLRDILPGEEILVSYGDGYDYTF